MLNNFQVNLYDNIKSPKIKSTISIDEWFAMIQNSKHKDLILAARQYQKGSTQYDGIKSMIPCVTYNFRFTITKSNHTIESETGLLYVDIDDPRFEPDKLNLSDVFAYYKSFGGNGYGLILKVEGLTLGNFHTTYKSILAQLNIMEYYDSGAVKPTQFNVLTYDLNIYINPESNTFMAVDIDPIPDVIREEEGIYTQGMGSIVNYDQSISFTNTDQIAIEGEYKVIAEGYTEVKCFFPKKKVTVGGRNKHLTAYCNNLVYLNQHLSEKGVMTILESFNTNKCCPPLNQNEVRSIVKSVFRYKHDGSLKPLVKKKKRKIVFAKNTNLTAEQKFRIAASECNKLRSNVSKQRIYDSIEGWDFSLGKITQKSVIEATGLNKKTVQKYWSEFKDYVAELNGAAFTSNSTCDIKEMPNPTKLTVNKFELTDTVQVYEFMSSLYQAVGEEIDFTSIANFAMVLDSSRTTIEKIVLQAILIFRDRQYSNSAFSEINIPRWMIEMFQDLVNPKAAA